MPTTNSNIVCLFVCFLDIVICFVYFRFRPFWLSPRQAMVVPVAARFDDYATEVTLNGVCVHVCVVCVCVLCAKPFD